VGDKACEDVGKLNISRLGRVWVKGVLKKIKWAEKCKETTEFA